MAQLFTNNAYGSLAATTTTSATSLTLGTGQGARFPSPTGGDYFNLTLIGLDGNGRENAWEIVKVTARAADALTVVRAQEGTTGVAWTAGTNTELRLTAAQIALFETHRNATGNPHGLVKGDISLGNVDNTSDASKPVSTAQAAADALKASLTGATFTGGVGLTDQVLTRAMLKDCGLSFYDSSTTNALDYTNGSHQRWAPSTGAQTLSVSNWPPSGNTGELLIEGVNLGAATITWPTGTTFVKSDGSFTTSFASSGITLQTSGTDFVVMWTRDAGTTPYVKVIR